MVRQCRIKKGIGERDEEGLEEEEGSENMREEGGTGRKKGKVKLMKHGVGENQGVKVVFWNVAGLENKDGDFWKE